MSQFLACLYTNAAAIVAAEVRRPLPRPAQTDDDALVALLDVEVAEGIVGRTPARCSNVLFNLGSQLEFVGLEVDGLRRTPAKMVQRKLIPRASLKPGIDGLNVLEDGRVGRTSVLEKQGPLHHGEIVVFDSCPAHHQSGSRILENCAVLSSISIELSDRTLLRPSGQEFRGRPAAINK